MCRFFLGKALVFHIYVSLLYTVQGIIGVYQIGVGMNDERVTFIIAQKRGSVYWCLENWRVPKQNSYHDCALIQTVERYQLRSLLGPDFCEVSPFRKIKSWINLEKGGPHLGKWLLMATCMDQYNMTISIPFLERCESTDPSLLDAGLVGLRWFGPEAMWVSDVQQQVSGGCSHPPRGWWLVGVIYIPFCIVDIGAFGVLIIHELGIPFLNNLGTNGMTEGLVTAKLGIMAEVRVVLCTQIFLSL